MVQVVQIVLRIGVQVVVEDMDTIHQLTLVHIAMLQTILPGEQADVRYVMGYINIKTQMVQKLVKLATLLMGTSQTQTEKAARRQSVQQGNTEAVQVAQDAQVTHINQTTTSQVQAAALVGQMKQLTLLIQDATVTQVLPESVQAAYQHHAPVGFGMEVDVRHVRVLVRHAQEVRQAVIVV